MHGADTLPHFDFNLPTTPSTQSRSNASEAAPAYAVHEAHDAPLPAGTFSDAAPMHDPHMHAPHVHVTSRPGYERHRGEQRLGLGLGFESQRGESLELPGFPSVSASASAVSTTRSCIGHSPSETPSPPRASRSPLSIALDDKGTSMTWQGGTAIMHGIRDPQHSALVAAPHAHAQKHGSGRTRPVTISAARSTLDATSASFGAMVGQRMCTKEAGASPVARRAEETGETRSLQGSDELQQAPTQRFPTVRGSIYGRASDEGP